ncbi:hypothetical protein VB796_16850 [Arcicella sp. LKC2W]|uniref:hypothetical protein n=1 Tax=Arcicella sp. LKC2W TaxID=2984198 RepID=UPI002B210CB9|nr:hypothetical protein [Arcicella sp. LKC2W]MEA5460729.1 hypothetical protein [Arcicella sp. LKC2W]
MLSEGVKVYFSEGINPSERISISDGVMLMESEDYQRIVYQISNYFGYAFSKVLM